MNTQKGFTLIEILITVTIIGVLTAIAIPAYNDHVIRGKLVEGTAGLSDGRVKLEQYFQDYRTYANAGLAKSPCPATTPNFTYVCSGLSAAGYLITANGKGNVASFSYTIDQSNTKATTKFKSGWGIPPAACWITTKGGTC